MWSLRSFGHLSFIQFPPTIFLLPLLPLAFQQSLSVLRLSLPRLTAFHLYLILFHHFPFLVISCKLLILPVIVFFIQSFSVNLIIQPILDVTSSSVFLFTISNFISDNQRFSLIALIAWSHTLLR